MEVLKGTHNFYTLMGTYGENTEDEVLEHYADTIRKKIKELFPENPTDKTTIINGTIFVVRTKRQLRDIAQHLRQFWINSISTGNLNTSTKISRASFSRAS